MSTSLPDGPEQSAATRENARPPSPITTATRHAVPRRSSLGPLPRQTLNRVDRCQKHSSIDVETRANKKCIGRNWLVRPAAITARNTVITWAAARDYSNRIGERGDCHSRCTNDYIHSAMRRALPSCRWRERGRDGGREDTRERERWATQPAYRPAAIALFAVGHNSRVAAV